MGAPEAGSLPADPRGDWFYCFKHDRVETREQCRRGDRLGPYESREAAEHWRDRLEARNERWDAQDAADEEA